MSVDFNANLLSRLFKLDIEKPTDLLYRLPNSYDNFTVPLKNVSTILKMQKGASFYATLRLDSVTIKTKEEVIATKKARGETPDKNTRGYAIVELSDGLTKTSAFIFGPTEPWAQLKSYQLGKVVHVCGKIGFKDGYTNLNNLEVVPPGDRNRIVARYNGREKVITPAKVADCTRSVLASNDCVAEVVSEIVERFDEDERSIIRICNLGYGSLNEVILALHEPKSVEDLEKALKAARKLNAYYEIRKALNATERKPCPEAAIPVDRTLIAKLVKDHPFTPTKDQRAAIWDIIQNLAEHKPMDRLLSADVGNGKTMAYGIPAAYMCSKGKNTVVLLPTEPLAGQVAANIQGWYPDIKVHLVTAGFSDEVKQGDMLVGTTAVITWLKNHPEWIPDFAITDEQQKMGTGQRDAMTHPRTHVLEATATPIPRTMAQTQFGSKSVSFIDDCPVVKSIKTKLIGNGKDDRLEALKTLKGWVKQGRRVAVIYPLVAEQQAYVFHIKAETQKEAEKIAKLLKASGVSVQSVKPLAEATELLNELDNTASDGFIAVVHGEELEFARLQKKYNKYMGDHALNCRYLGSQLDDDLSRKNRTTIESAAQGWEKIYPGRIAVIHGRSHRTKKGEIIEFMNNGGADVLLSTTLIEIGVDVKDLNCVMVVGADRMGAFTLHQLRGRIARNGGTGDFIMMAGSAFNDIDPIAKARMELLVKYTRGSDIAQYDMEQRGFGNLAAGGQAQKGFDDGLFPGLKVSTAEIESFLVEVAQAMKAEREAGLGLSLSA
ncbi:DEAD/DEAH box helicase [Pseudomonas serbica]|jgi:RecG-like helicase|uniref:DEAD/DEAH box helicase n=1 Tax=Pseudomonas serbica TaxID=2965074 RepID=UPI00237ACC1D|nr:DEAD/DEAH box helicase [Pseudomonas serbica]